MDVSVERAAFEAAFPPPGYVLWCAKFQTYYTREPGIFAHGQTGLYAARWNGWRERARRSNE